MSLYTTPLQLGYFFSLLMWLIFLFRGYKEQRLSDKLLGWIMFILAMELQDYTFGFAGINILWNELNGFPRGVTLLFGPIVYFYFRAQVNRNFRITKKQFWHFVPYAIYFIYEISGFVQGPEVVQRISESTYDLILSYLLRITIWASYIYYFSKCLIIYQKYRKWSIHQFSNTELINFVWFRNFLFAMIFWLMCREIMNTLDSFLNLDFYQDWWWNLALVAVAFYIGLAGFVQKQPTKIHFELAVNSANKNAESESRYPENNEIKSSVATKLTTLMREDRLYLQPDLNLQELAQHLQINAVQLSSTINQAFGQNFNDYINGLRVEEFIRLCNQDQSRKYTLLSIAYDAGFNSKATFNRAFKKVKGSSPKEYFQSKDIP